MIPTPAFPSRIASLFAAFLLAGPGLPAQNHSSLVYPGADGRLVYEGYANEGQVNADNLVIDFSRAGYRGGGVAIPWVPVAITLNPEPGERDDHARIQSAISALSAMPLSSAGFRGTLLLRAGHYRVSQPLRISADGIVIRGEGQHTRGTVITFTATTQSDLFEFFGTGGWTAIAMSNRPITDTFVPSGARSFNVASTAGLEVGDRLMVHRTPNQAWIDMLDMERYGWTAASYRSQTPRVITAIDNNTITVDAPLVHAIESRYGGGEVFRYHFNGALRNVGIERIRLESAYASATDEDHGWNAVRFSRVENGWARQVTARYFGYSCIDIRGQSKFITVEDCAQLDPVSLITGSRRYSFNISQASFVLMQRCYTRNGRHDYVTGSRTRGPNVFVDSLAENTHSDIGPHHRYAEGLLFDNVKGGPINVQNRRTSGTGHGWAGAQTVFWNCHATTMICDAPQGAMNFAIGCVGTQRQGSWPPPEPDGIWESRGVPVTPRSLYYAQLADRLGPQAVATVTTRAQQEGTIWAGLSAWRGDAEAPGLPEFAPLRIDAGPDVTGEIESLELNAIIRHPLPRNFPMTVHGWTQLSGPAGAVFENALNPSTRLTFPSPGVYELQFALSQDDNRDPLNIVTHSGSDTLVVTVTGPPFATVEPGSVDRIVGRRQANAPELGYHPDAGGNIVGGTGSNPQLTRNDSDLVLGFPLPNLPAGSSLIRVSLSFEITAYRNESGADPGLDVYLLDTDAPEESGTGFFFRGEDDPNPAAVRVGGVNLNEPPTSEVVYPPGTHLTSFELEGDAFALLQGYYGEDGAPLRSTVYFRFNLTHSVGSDDPVRLDRYRIDTGPGGSSLAFFEAPDPGAGNTFAAWIAGFDLDPDQRGPADDPDGDGIPNAVENFFGTHPGEPTRGVAILASGEGSFTFTHPQNPSPADNVRAAYRWSSDLAIWHGDGEIDANGTTVAITSSSENDITTVHVHPSGTPASRLFVRIEVTVD